MKHFLLAVCLLLPAMAADFTRRLTPDEVQRLIQDEKNLFLLDVRAPGEIAAIGAVKGYVNIPIAELEGRLKEVPKDKIIVTICTRAVRASNAAEILSRNGYNNIAGACALGEWKEQKKPLVQQPAEN
ncbi:MAG: hypothetical protein HY820_35950 [Acidobacteria bacterium]|nr:hypothetical protein [Acidobacteriota bacterium]